MKEFADKVAVVTGGASGIGRAIADRFAREGMKIVLADVEAPALEVAVKEMEQQGARVHGVRTDVSSLADIERLRDETLATFGGVHLLVNNAGIGSGGPIVTTPIERWRWMLEVNFWGVIHGCQTFVPLPVEQGEGHVVNVASLAGVLGTPTSGAYSCTKKAVIGYSEVLSQELAGEGSPVKVSVVCPGLVRTRGPEAERNRPAYVPPSEVADAAAKGWAQAYEMGLAMEPADLAEVVFRDVSNERFYIFPDPEGAEMYISWLTAWMRDDVPPGFLEMMPK